MEQCAEWLKDLAAAGEEYAEEADWEEEEENEEHEEQQQEEAGPPDPRGHTTWMLAIPGGAADADAAAGPAPDEDEEGYEEGYEEEEEGYEEEEEEAGPPPEISRLRHAGPPHRHDGEERPWLLPPSRWWQTWRRSVAGPDYSRELDAANGGPRQRPPTPELEPHIWPLSGLYQSHSGRIGALPGPGQDLNAPLNASELALLDSGRCGKSGRVVADCGRCDVCMDAR